MTPPHPMPSYKPSTSFYDILHNQWSRQLHTSQVIAECEASGFKIDRASVHLIFMLLDAQMEKDIGLPIPMILHCPSCHAQHIDAPDIAIASGKTTGWDNPPHRSHLCHQCGTIWRPADVPTEGVAEIKTRGKHDHREDFSEYAASGFTSDESTVIKTGGKHDVVTGGIVSPRATVFQTASSTIEDAMTIQHLRSQVDHQRNVVSNVVSRAINVLEQVKIAVEEGDTNEALRLITEATA